MKKLYVLVMALLAFSLTPVQADTFGGAIEVSYWLPEYEGDFAIDSNDVNFGPDLGIRKGKYFEVAAILEHPIPFVPNLKVRYTDINETGVGFFEGRFDTQDYSGDVSSIVDLTNMDGVLYYPVLNNWLKLDAGLSVKAYDGVFDIEDRADSERFSNTLIDEVVPMLYISGNFTFPSSDIIFGADVMITSFDDTQMHDYKIRLKQDWGLMYGELGFREIRLDLEDIDNLDVDITLGGYYVALGVHL